MFLIRFILVALPIFLTTEAFAKTHCVCEIGQVSNQKLAYKAGCKLWFTGKKCNSRTIVDRGQNGSLEAYLPPMQDGDRLRVGYVGHWKNSTGTQNYLSQNILSLVQTHSVEVTYDNTACFPMNNPEMVQSYLNRVLVKPGSSIKVSGSQNRSIGIWDLFFPGPANFNAYASTEWSAPRFWPCSAIENRACYGHIQNGQQGRCVDQSGKYLVWLTCKRPSWFRRFRWSR